MIFVLKNLELKCIVPLYKNQILSSKHYFLII